VPVVTVLDKPMQTASYSVLAGTKEQQTGDNTEGPIPSQLSQALRSSSNQRGIVQRHIKGIYAPRHY
jgi:hypothetical protein